MTEEDGSERASVHYEQDAVGEMARLLPGLRRSWPSLAAPPELPPEQERRYLFNNVTEVLERRGQNSAICHVL